MDSPEATKDPASASASASSPPVKDSPFSSYVSSLSPIQYSNSRHGLRTYGDLNFPSPEPVFTSPHITLPRKSDTVRSSLSLPLGLAKVQHSNDSSTSSGNMVRSGQFASALMVQSTPSSHESKGNPASKHETCGASSGCVNVFLSDPSDACENASASPECSNQAAEMPQNVHGICTGTNNNQAQCYKEEFACLQSATPSDSALLDEFIADPAEHSDSPDLESKHPAVVPPQVVHSDSISSQETNTQIHESLAEKIFLSQTTEYLTSSSNAEKGFAGDEASFLVNPSFNDGKNKVMDEAKGLDEVSPDEQLVPTINDGSIDSHSFTLGAAGHQPEVDILDPKRRNGVSSRLNDKDNNGLSHEKPAITSFFCHNVRDARLLISTQELGELHSTPQCLPESLQDVEAVGSVLGGSGEKLFVSTENQIPYEEDSTQHQRGMRKRLQFDAVANQKANTEYAGHFNKLSRDISCSEPPETSVDMHTSSSSHLESFETPGMKQGSQPLSENGPCKVIVKVDSSGQKNGGSSIAVPKPSGIGLHLNSLGSMGNLHCSTVVQLLGKNSGMDDSLFLGCSDNLSQGLNMELVSTDFIEKCPVTLTENSEQPIPDSASEDSVDKHVENHVIELQTSSVSHQTPQHEKAIQCSMQSQHADRYMTPCNLKRPLSVDDSIFNVSSQSSPKKKRKKASDSEGQKRCSCKKSKCLKLYCDCFAAGIFCSEVCGCQQCANRPDNEDTIREAKQQIESRNPLAFAPKVVVCVSDPPKDTEESLGRTPNSARHKRGCNCKKSLCLKKYCECYQAGVGCSFGCRCEGCKNTFGRRDGCGEIVEIEHKKSNELNWERDPSTQKLSKSERKSRLSPLTPSLPVTSGADADKSIVPASYYTSPETSASVLPCYEGSSGSPMDSISKSTSDKARESTILMVPYDPELDFDMKVDTFSPGWDGFPDICNPSPSAKISPSNDGPSASSKTKEHKVLQTMLFEGSSLALSSLGWRCSPMTPLQQFGESKMLMEPDSDSGLNKNPEDDTPEILKETCSPSKGVKTTSPKQKRVSPPKRLMLESRSSSSSIRSGRKFILQSVPSFPPLTPYSNNSRGSGA